MIRRYFDAHIHWFQDSKFGEILAENIGDSCDQEYFMDSYYRRQNTLVGGIVMGNGDIMLQGKSIPEGFYYCLGLDVWEQVCHLDEYLDLIEQHLMRPECVGIKIYPGYIPIYPNSGYYRPIYELLMRYKKVLAVHTGMLGSLAGKLKYAHPLCLDDVAVDHPDLKIVMCHFGNPFLSEAAAVMERNGNVSADLSGLIEGVFDVSEFMYLQGSYVEELKMWINYIGDYKRFLFGSDWPAVKSDIYSEFVAMLFPQSVREDILMNNAFRVYHIKDS
jgi:hypothetical protein